MLVIGGYVALSLTPAALLVRALLAGGTSAVTVGFEAGLLLVGAAAVAAERERSFGTFPASPLDRTDVTRVLAVVVAAVLTYALNVHAGLTPVLASALVGLVAGVAATGVDAPAYCGSFVGMASPTLFPSAAHVVVAALFAGLAFVAAKRAFAGFGGKLGTLALFGCATTATLTGADYVAAGTIQWPDARLVVPVAVVGAVAAFVVSVRLDVGAVVGSAVVGLAAGLALPVVAPGSGGTLAAVAFCASFVGMSSRNRLASEFRVALVGGACGLVFVAVSGTMSGAGGKLGTIAFISCVSLAGVERLVGALDSFAPLRNRR